MDVSRTYVMLNQLLFFHNQLSFMTSFVGGTLWFYSILCPTITLQSLVILFFSSIVILKALSKV